MRGSRIARGAHLPQPCPHRTPAGPLSNSQTSHSQPSHPRELRLLLTAHLSLPCNLSELAPARPYRRRQPVRGSARAHRAPASAPRARKVPGARRQPLVRGEKVGGELGQPLGLDLRQVAHVELGREEQLVEEHAARLAQGGAAGRRGFVRALW